MILATLLEDESLKLFGIEIFNTESFGELLLRFALNFFIVFLLIRWLYYGSTRRKDYLFSYFIIGSLIFLLCYLLGNVKLQLGFTLGLFAVFGIIRYRTDSVPIKEMTYLFLVIGISVINALTNKKVSYVELGFTNIILVFLVYGLEKLWLLKHESVKTILYERIDLIKPEFRKELIQDLEDRTGIKPINRVDIGRIDFLKDTARLQIYYFETSDKINQADIEDTFGHRGGDDD
jgi:hypothetical protein